MAENSWYKEPKYVVGAVVVPLVVAIIMVLPGILYPEPAPSSAINNRPQIKVDNNINVTPIMNNNQNMIANGDNHNADNSPAIVPPNQPPSIDALDSQVTSQESSLVTTSSVLADDFSRDTGLWSYSGNAYRDAQNGYIVLTSNKDLQVGNIWLNQDIASPFTIEFRYKAGGGTGADGLTLMFYKDKNYKLGKGGLLGFNSETGEVAPGYGIEFDNYENSNFSDPTERHIALIKDSVVNHLRSAGDQRTEDNQWHQVMVEVNTRSIVVYVDGDQVINFEGDIDKNYGGLGFSAATWSYNNWHLIDDVRIST